MKRIMTYIGLASLLLGVPQIASAGFLDSVMEYVPKDTSTQSQNSSLLQDIQKQTGLTSTQSAGALGTLLGYAQNNMSKTDYSSITNKMPELNSLTSSANIAPIVSSLTSSDMVQSTLKGFGIDPSLVQTIVPILVDYVSNSAGKNSGDLLSNALSGLLQ